MRSTSIGPDSFVSFLKSLTIQLLFEFKFALILLATGCSCSRTVESSPASCLGVWMVLRAAPRCFSHHHPTLTSRVSRRRPPDVATFSHASSNVAGLSHTFPAAIQLATLRIFDPQSLVRFPPPTVSRLRTRFCSALVVPNFVPWSVANRANGVWFNGLIGSRWNNRHRLGFCVLQKRHVLLVHKSEIVLELETELQPSPLIVVVRSRSCSKFQDFCRGCRY